MNLDLTGTGVALVTPFQQEEVDFDGLRNVIEHVVAGGVDYVVALGTTGETPTLTPSEQFQILDFTIETVAGRVPVVAGFGGNDTRGIVRAIQSYHFDGVAAILSSSPAYNKPTQEGLFQHYRAIEQVAPRPIIIYNVPSRTARNIAAETTLRLAHESPKFIAVKEASGDLVQCMHIARDKPAHFQLLSGDDLTALPMLSFGATGVISVIANAFPKAYTTLIKAGLRGDFKEAQYWQLALLELVELLFVEGNPTGVKAALEILGVCSKEVRLPLVELSPATLAKMKQAVQNFQNQAVPLNR